MTCCLAAFLVAGLLVTATALQVDSGAREADGEVDDDPDFIASAFPWQANVEVDDDPDAIASAFPWQQLLLARKPGAGGRAAEGVPGVDMGEMMKLMQEFVDYIKDDNFMRSFATLASGYQDTGVLFRHRAEALVSELLNSTESVGGTAMMPMVGKFFDNIISMIKVFVDDMLGRMSMFMQSMPTGLLNTKTRDLIPALTNVTQLINQPGDASKGDESIEHHFSHVEKARFCDEVEPIFINASRAVRELGKLTKVINASQKTIPMIGRFINQMIPDSPESADVAPRVMMLEDQLLNTTYSMVFSLREVTRGYSSKVGTLIQERMHCKTVNLSGGPSLSFGPIGLLVAAMAVFLQL